MDKLTKTLLTTFSLLLVGISIPSQAQIWKDMGRKIEKKVEDQANRRLERKIDQAIDKGFDKTEQAIDESVKGDEEKPKDEKRQKEKTESPAPKTKAPNNSSSPDASKLAAIMAGMSGQATVLDQYIFKVGIDYTTSITKENGKKEGETAVSMWLSDKGYIGMGQGSRDNFIVTDLENKTTIIFQSKEKTYMAMSSDIGGMVAKMAEETGAADESANASDVKFEKLSRSEKILGYDCDIYRIETDEVVSTIWVTPALKVNYMALMNSFGNLTKNAKGRVPAVYQNQINGVMLKTETLGKKDKETTLMEATKVDDNGRVIDVSSYKRSGM